MSLTIDQISRAFSQAVIQSLEQLAFIEVIPINENTPPLPDELTPKPRTNVAWALTPVVQPLEGKILMIMPPELGQMLTEIMFGEIGSGDVTKEAMLDAVAETSNVIAGRVMNELIGDNAEFELGLPEKGLSASDEEVPMYSTASYRLDYAIEGFTLTVMLNGKDFQTD